MKTILITGAGGFIGTRLADSFRTAGWNVVADVSNRVPAIANASKTAVSSKSATATRTPLTLDRLRTLCGTSIPDAVVHAAGSGTVGLVAADPCVEMSANLASTVAVLEYVRQFAPTSRVLALSSAALYGSAPATPQREDDARSPVSLYGIAKAQAEQVCRFYAESYAIDVTISRLFSVYGPGLRKQLLWDAMNKFRANQSEFFGTGDERRDWIHIADVCRFAQRVFEVQRGPAFEIVNCASGYAASTAEILSHLAMIAHAPKPTFNGVSRAGDPTCLVADCDKARRELGWHAQISWRDGVAEYAEWFESTVAPFLER